MKTGCMKTARICMKAQGSKNDLKFSVRPPLAPDSDDRECSCTCMKTTTKSGQARRGLDGAQRGMTINFIGRGPMSGSGQKKDRHGGGQGRHGVVKR